MKILYYDCFAGLSGDMNLAAMVDLGVDPDFLHAELDKLGLGNEFALHVSRDARNGIHGTRVDVVLCGDAHTHSHDEQHVHRAHHADHDGHPHSHDTGHGHSHHHAHGHHHTETAHTHHDHAAHDHQPAGHAPHRNFADIRAIIMGSALADEIKETSLRIFRRVAEAEAQVHGKPVEEVHFHEVGATDSIVDIVGAAICYHSLGVEAVWSSPVELGSGVVRCAHGLIPVPAPATAAILEGIPTTRGAIGHEATTPTGAAILAELTDEFVSTPAMTVMKTGYGIGHRETELPNLTRVHLATVVADELHPSSQARMLQCNIDDMTGEQLGDVMELLMEQGAMDVHFTSIMMKKNRPGTQISLLCSGSEEPCYTELLFRHTTTLGVKSFALEKTMLERRFRQVETQHGPVRIKEAILNGEMVHSKPEYEDCKAIARKTGMALSEVYAIVARQG